MDYSEWEARRRAGGYHQCHSLVYRKLLPHLNLLHFITCMSLRLNLLTLLLYTCSHFAHMYVPVHVLYIFVLSPLACSTCSTCSTSSILSADNLWQPACRHGPSTCKSHSACMHTSTLAFCDKCQHRQLVHVHTLNT